jgi:hypothetical protein
MVKLQGGAEVKRSSGAQPKGAIVGWAA